MNEDEFYKFIEWLASRDENGDIGSNMTLRGISASLHAYKTEVYPIEDNWDKWCNVWNITDHIYKIRRKAKATHDLATASLKCD